ncbi:MAG: o-succinylbenzoate--CoA ligase [Candidatus Hydrogenedentes bacterium]|nr:o-succinylbenzoate--CoA ligase [Candidatus Hydrogenedentota bacterium]
MSERSWPLAVPASHISDAPAIVCSDGVTTFSEYAEHVERIAGVFHRSGIRPGDRIAILSLPSVDYPKLLMGCFHAGAVACPLNTRVPRQSLADFCQRLDVKALCVDEAFSNVSFDGIPSLEATEILDASPTEPAPHLVDPRQPAVILSTSGSSGEPKSALHTLGSLSQNAFASNRNLPLNSGDRWLLSLPLFHVSGLGIVFRCLWSGAAIVVRKPEETLEDLILQYDVTHVSLVATQLFRLLQTQKGMEALGKLKAILVGGSAIPASVIGEAYVRKLPICTTYGLTETGSQVTATRPGDPLRTLQTSGRPLLPDTVSISPDGEILVRGATLFQGYVDSGKAELPLTPEGWFATGDLGEFDAAGNLRVLGRRDNMFTSGGENIQPEEVERWLCRLEGVVEAVVVPVQNAEFGARPVAFVRVAQKEFMQPIRFQLFLEENIPGYKVPDIFLPWPDERDEHGMKIDREHLRDLAELHQQTEEV